MQDIYASTQLGKSIDTQSTATADWLSIKTIDGKNDRKNQIIII